MAPALRNAATELDPPPPREQTAAGLSPPGWTPPSRTAPDARRLPPPSPPDLWPPDAPERARGRQGRTKEREGRRAPLASAAAERVPEDPAAALGGATGARASALFSDERRGDRGVGAAAPPAAARAQARFAPQPDRPSP